MHIGFRTEINGVTSYSRTLTLSVSWRYLLDCAYLEDGSRLGRDDGGTVGRAMVTSTSNFAVIISTMIKSNFHHDSSILIGIF